MAEPKGQEMIFDLIIAGFVVFVVIPVVIGVLIGIISPFLK